MDSLLHKPQASLQIPSGIVKIETCYLYHEKLLMIKYSRMQKEIPSQLVCGSVARA